VITCFDTEKVLTFVVKSATGVGKQRNVAGTLNGPSQLALMSGACAGLAAWSDLAIIRDKSAQDIRQFVINGHMLISTELADFGTGIIAPFLSLIHFIVHGIIHRIFTPI
jgi:hypothetical protein